MAKQEQTDAFENDGPGVGSKPDKKLSALADEFSDLVEKCSDMSEEITATEAKILDRMNELGLRIYKYSDKVVRIKDGKPHVKLKTAKGEKAD